MSPYMYNEFDNTKNIVQPQFIRYRNIYRGPRNSQKENLEQDSFIQDVEKLKKRIVNAEGIIKTMTAAFYFHKAATPNTLDATPFFSASFWYYNDESQTPEINGSTLTLSDTVEISSRLFRIMKKINRMEN